MTDATYVFADVPIRSNGTFDLSNTVMVKRWELLVALKPQCLCVVKFSGDVRYTTDGIGKEEAEVVGILVPPHSPSFVAIRKRLFLFLGLIIGFALPFVFTVYPQSIAITILLLSGLMVGNIVRRYYGAWSTRHEPERTVETTSYLAKVPSKKVIQAANSGVPIYSSLAKMWEDYPITQIDWSNLEEHGLPTLNTLEPHVFWSLPVV